MARVSPISDLHRRALASFLAYGPEGPARVEVVETYGELELEYAAIRKHCALLDHPQRAVLDVSGKERTDFLNRMLTQELKGLEPGRVRRAFWLNRKGRIDADLRVIALADQVLLELDVLAAERTVKGLSSYIISEDVSIRDLTESGHRFAVHGPTSPALLGALVPARDIPEVGEARQVQIANTTVVVWRDDTAGEPGFEFLVPTDASARFYQLLIETGHDAAHTGAAALRQGPITDASRIQLRPAGWHAYNIARIEAGTPLYNIDFGENSLPAESGVLNDRVSFTKGCYLGQEIVARMHARGHSKQVLVAIRFESVIDPETEFPIQPVTGAHLFPGESNEPIGAVASSTISPMLSSSPIAFAQIKQSHQTPGTVVEADAQGKRIKGVVQAALKFWKRASD